MKTLYKSVCLVVMALGTGCGFYAEVEAPRVCERAQAVTFDGVAAAPVQLDVITLSKELEYKLANGLADFGPDSLESKVRIVEVKFLAVDEQTTLDFIQDAQIDILPAPGSGLEVKNLLSFKRTQPGAGDREILLESSDEALDIRDYAQGESIKLNAALTGAWPQQGATMDVNACVGMSARTDLL